MKLEEEYWVVVKVCGEVGFVLEFMGGIDLVNFGVILEIVLEVGVF